MRGTHRFQKYGTRAYPVAYSYVHWLSQASEPSTDKITAPAATSTSRPPTETERSPIMMDTRPDEPSNPGKRLLERLPTELWPSNKRRKTPTDQELDQSPTCSTREKQQRYPPDMMQQMRFLARFFPMAESNPVCGDMN